MHPKVHNKMLVLIIKIVFMHFHRFMFKLVIYDENQSNKSDKLYHHL